MNTTRAPGAVLLATGIVLLEFAAAITSFVTTTLLPIVAADLRAYHQLALLIIGATLGLFVALPLASRVIHRLGIRPTLAVGVGSYLSGALVAATAQSPWIFAAGQLAEGFASGLLAVFGISTAIKHLDTALRIRVIAMSSAMWIAPALVGPSATLALEHLVGWRCALLAPVPIVVIGRLLIVRATARQALDRDRQEHPLRRTMLIPAGVFLLVIGTTGGAWLTGTVGIAGFAMAMVGLVAILPAGTARLRRGAPAGLAAMFLFGAGYSGAASLITVLLTDGYRATAGQAAIMLGAAPFAWGLTSLLTGRVGKGKTRWTGPAAGLAATAAGTGVLTMAMLPSAFGVALVAWTAAGAGIGFAYPRLYILSTTPDASLSATELATAVVTAETLGGLFGRSVGGAIIGFDATHGGAGSGGLLITYGLFALLLVAATLAATRAPNPGANARVPG
ncbi:MFS transporter [Tamaricihabitans halophyticus]|uniref:MFS transporter n=1 Tax=Tamaricihabitans halophyticus TaxID=1262583 RepID=A0A4R2QHL3_9PSEU|nr:MFS transporter [Tamaricihabitans halophyticus]TCP47848.1 MFS transporter [Tamaricihabitans halophyticus]